MALQHAHAGEDTCGGACSPNAGEFCGIDGKCREMSCGYGPRSRTGYATLGSAGLTCENVNRKARSWQRGYRLGVVYDCATHIGDVDDEKYINRAFTRTCAASGEANGTLVEFLCREMANGTDFGAFLSDANATRKFDGEGGARVCPNGNGAPAFIYPWAFTHTTVAPVSAGGTTVINEVGRSPSSTDEFNATRALMAVSVDLSFRLPPPPPTPEPATPEPTTPEPTTFEAAGAYELSTGTVVAIVCAAFYQAVL
eukprot:TRINITY_DN13657_c0_g1_i1.p1 TRINITY_DN13657_c0_g1~~TRINITY_DN13657_c0_g1_i1.p1  ORF type:complete len:255 (+),score=31.23 TRINITY_DN13657_c0_g1_i1:73-837(+)